MICSPLHQTFGDSLRLNSLVRPNLDWFHSVCHDVMAAAQYKYAPLRQGQIRLLSLSHGQRDEPLMGELHPEHLYESHGANTKGHHQTIPFEALSYVWGSESRPHTLITTGGRLSLTESLHNFLVRLRLPDRPRWLWADGICINQEDPKEKEQQVQLMAQIFGSASTVLADLGQHSHDSDQALQLINRYWRVAICAGVFPADATNRQKALSPYESATYLGLSATDVDLSWANHQLPPSNDEQWTMVRSLICRPWFSRLWIVQEFILAREVHFFVGDTVLNWRHLYALCCNYQDTGQPQFSIMLFEAGNSLQQQRSFSLLGIMAAQRGVRALRSSEEGRALLQTLTKKGVGVGEKDHGGVQPRELLVHCHYIDLLQWYRHCQCTLQRDRYYALLSIASDVSAVKYPELRPNYTTELHELSLRFGRFFIQRPNDGVRMFLRAGLGMRDDLDDAMPSWMQNFGRSLGDSDPDAEYADLLISAQAAGRDSVFTVTMVPDQPEVIGIRAYKVDEVLGVAVPNRLSTPQEVGHRSEIADVIVNHIIDAFNIFSIRLQSPTEPMISVDKNCLEAMIQSMYMGNKDQNDTWDMSVLVLGFFSFLFSRQDDMSLQGFENWPSVMAEILVSDYGYNNLCAQEEEDQIPEDRIENAMTQFLRSFGLPLFTGLRSGITRYAPFAAVPAGTEPRDEVWIVSGCKQPVILRKSTRHDGMYRLVGVCYAHGIMDGSVLQRPGFAFQDLLLH